MALSQTSVRFIQGVPFDNSYAHTRWFQTRTQQYNYFTSFPSIQRTQNNFQKSTGRMAIEVSEHVETMMNYDYMMYRNASYGNKWFYAFILNVEHVSRNTTRVYFEVDPIQTYMFDVDIKPSYVLREHSDDTKNIYPEGLQMGSEYETIHTWDVKPHPFYYMVIVTKERIDDNRPTEVIPIAQGLTRGTVQSLYFYYYPIPKDVASLHFTVASGGQATEGFWANDNDIRRILSFLQHSPIAVNNVVSIYLTEYLPLEHVSHVEGNSHYYNHSGSFYETLGDGHVPIVRILSTPVVNSLPTLSIPVGNLFQTFTESESKLMYYPYTVLELSDGRGNVMNYKPEGFLDVNGQLELMVIGSLNYQNSVAYGFKGYNGNTTPADVLDYSIINTDPQDLPILTNQTASYIQGAKNSMQAKQNTWKSLENYQELSAVNRIGTSAGNIMGGFVGLGMNALNMGYAINMLSTGMGNLIQGGIDFMQAGEDYQNKINEQNAIVEDLNNVPPSMQKQGNNPNMSIGNNMHGVRVRLKRVRPQYLDRAREYMKLFGHKVNRLKQPNIRTRTHFNYVQTTMLNVQSPIYNDDILRFKHIFDQGITLWHTNDIHNYNVANNRR